MQKKLDKADRDRIASIRQQCERKQYTNETGNAEAAWLARLLLDVGGYAYGSTEYARLMAYESTGLAKKYWPGDFTDTSCIWSCFACMLEYVDALGLDKEEETPAMELSNDDRALVEKIREMVKENYAQGKGEWKGGDANKDMLRLVRIVEGVAGKDTHKTVNNILVYLTRTTYTPLLSGTSVWEHAKSLLTLLDEKLTEAKTMSTATNLVPLPTKEERLKEISGKWGSNVYVGPKAFCDLYTRIQSEVRFLVRMIEDLQTEITSKNAEVEKLKELVKPLPVTGTKRKVVLFHRDGITRYAMYADGKLVRAWSGYPQYIDIATALGYDAELRILKSGEFPNEFPSDYSVLEDHFNNVEKDKRTKRKEELQKELAQLEAMENLG